MGEEQAFATVESEQVGVPVLVTGLHGRQVFRAGAQKLQCLGRAPQNHANHGMYRWARIQAAADSGSRAYSRNNPPSRS